MKTVRTKSLNNLKFNDNENIHSNFIKIKLTKKPVNITYINNIKMASKLKTQTNDDPKAIHSKTDFSLYTNMNFHKKQIINTPPNNLTKFEGGDRNILGFTGAGEKCFLNKSIFN